METDITTERRLREAGFAFFGRISASVTHEINNVLSTISELSGLLQDLLTAAERQGSVPPEKLQRLAEGLTIHVKKGAGIVKRLNTFAHSTDQAVKLVELTDVLESITSLARRLVNLKQINLETNFSPDSLAVQTNPFMLQHAVFVCIDLVLSHSACDRPITISSGKAKDGAEIVIESSPLSSAGGKDEGLSLLSVLMQQLAGTMKSMVGEDGAHRFILTIPSAGPA